LLQDSLATFERDKDLRFRIVGFSDCIGPEQDNLKLRQERANAVFRLLGKSAQSRVVSLGPAQPGTFVPGTDNSTITGRARNRSVVIEFWRDSEAKKPTGLPPLPESVKKRIEAEAEGPMEIERRRREGEKKRYEPVPVPKGQSLKDQVRARLRAEGIPDIAIEQIFKTATAAGPVAAKAAVNGMAISEAAKEFVKARLKDIYSWSW
jgi:hypothetical protein